jgi:transcriptional regulator with XRE-family HTH domain
MPTKKSKAAPATPHGPSRQVGVSADLGVRLREGRERKAFTVRGLARYVGVSPSLVSQIERGKVMPSVGTLYAIANQPGRSVGCRGRRLGFLCWHYRKLYSHRRLRRFRPRPSSPSVYRK